MSVSSSAGRCRAAALALALIASGACFSPQLRDGQFVCGPGGICPTCMRCGSDGRCYAGELPDAGAPGSDGAPGDATGDGPGDQADGGDGPPDRDGFAGDVARDAPRDATVPVDGRDAAADRPSGPCDPTAPFGEPVPVSELNSDANEEHVFLTRDGRTMFFTSDRAGGVGGYDIWRASRSSPDGTFGEPEPVSELNTPSDELSPSLTADGRTVYFGSERTGRAQIFRARRASTDEPFGNAEVVSALNPNPVQYDAHVSADGTLVLFSSVPEGATGADLYAAVQAPDGNFLMARPLTILNTEALDANPALSSDGLTLYFTSERPGVLGDRDIFVSRRDPNGRDFGAPELVRELSLPGREVSVTVSPDGCALYFTSDVIQPGNGDILVARRR